MSLNPKIKKLVEDSNKRPKTERHIIKKEYSLPSLEKTGRYFYRAFLNKQRAKNGPC